jgi:hypothetical protein
MIKVHFLLVECQGDTLLVFDLQLFHQSRRAHILTELKEIYI